ncbi:MAG: HlyD family type I secretion periplasmic adaptor subunit [Pseudomonadota bacterium]
MTPRSAAQPSIRRHIIAGIVVIAILVLGFGGWAGTTQLSGALIAPGQIVVDSNVKKVQHPTGGIVGEVRVRDGDTVKEGDIVVRLDETVTRANLAIVTKGLNELSARKARLEAERDNAQQIRFPPLLTGSNDPDVRNIMDSEEKLFELRRTARAGQKSQLRQRIAQLQEEITGLTAQQNAKAREIELIDRELAGVRDLFSKNLIQMNRLTQLEREATRLQGERGQLIATTAQAKGKISELELQIIQIDQELSSEVAKEMRDVDAKIGEFVERKVTAEDQLRRIDIRAPQAGTVFQSTVHTVGGVISAGDAIMLIVPAADNLTVEAKVNPQDINQLQLGQKAILRFTAFNQQTTPEIEGAVSRISADITTDQRTGLGYYTIRIALPADQVARLGDVKLVPGMPVEAFVQTGDRTVISYLMKPLSDHFNRAFREK